MKFLILASILVLFTIGIVGVQESFADSYEKDIADYLYNNKDALILLATHSSTEPVKYPYHETTHKYVIDEVLNGEFTNDYANISTEFGGEFGKQYVLVVYPHSLENNPLELIAWALDTSSNVSVHDSKMNQVFVDPTQLTKFIVSLPGELTNYDVKNLVQESFAEESSLKQQLAANTSLLEISCPDEKHVLSKRSNDKLACVTPYTMAKLELNPVDHSFWSIIIKNEQRYGIFTYLSKTQNVESVKYNQDMNSAIIHVISDKSEKLSVNVNREILESGNETCQQMPPWDDYFVLINGEEVAYEKRLTTDNYRYLELDIDQQEQSLSEILLHSKEIHKLHDIPFEEDSMIIEIIGTCLV